LGLGSAGFRAAFCTFRRFIFPFSTSNLASSEIGCAAKKRKKQHTSTFYLASSEAERARDKEVKHYFESKKSRDEFFFSMFMHANSHTTHTQPCIEQAACAGKREGNNALGLGSAGFRAAFCTFRRCIFPFSTSNLASSEIGCAAKKNKKALRDE